VKVEQGVAQFFNLFDRQSMDVGLRCGVQRAKASL
jgi:hypothetical protein